ncbi:UNVERIFIED_CONTAM: hypothetical protein K2H54_001600 [Gekko kuhli]
MNIHSPCWFPGGLSSPSESTRKCLSELRSQKGGLLNPEQRKAPLPTPSVAAVLCKASPSVAPPLHWGQMPAFLHLTSHCPGGSLLTHTARSSLCWASFLRLLTSPPFGRGGGLLFLRGSTSRSWPHPLGKGGTSVSRLGTSWAEGARQPQSLSALPTNSDASARTHRLTLVSPATGGQAAHSSCPAKVSCLGVSSQGNLQLQPPPPMLAESTHNQNS